MKKYVKTKKNKMCHNKTRKLRKQKGGLLPLLLLTNAIPLAIRSGPAIAYIGSGLFKIISSSVKYTIEVGDKIDKIDKVVNAGDLVGKVIKHGKKDKKKKVEEGEEDSK